MFLFFGCEQPTCDDRLRAGEVDAANVIWSIDHDPLPFAHPAADALARTARIDPAVSCAVIAEQMVYITLLDRTPLRGRRPLDLSFARIGPMLQAAFALGASVVAIGRSENPGERESISGGALPWVDGRLVGGAVGEAGARSLGQSLDADAPARLVTLAMMDGTRAVHIAASRTDTGWLAMSSLTPDDATRWVMAGEAFASGGSEAVRARIGTGLGEGK